MLRPLLAALLAALLALAGLAAPALAQGAREQAFIDIQTAYLIDDKCHFLKHFERQRSYEIERGLLDALDFKAAFVAGKITEDEYDANYAKLMNMAQPKADAIACTDNAAAAPYILGLRDQVARLLYSDLAIAFEAGMLSQELQQVAFAYEGMIAPLYGQNWEGFVQQARGLAQARINEARQADAAGDPFGLSGFFVDEDCYLEDIYCEDDPLADLFGTTINFDSLVQSTLRTPEAILLEMAAEQSGYRRIERVVAGTSLFRDLLVDMNLRPVMDLWEVPGRFEALDTGVKFYAAFTVAEDGAVRVMTYGADAERMRNGMVVMMVHEPLTGENSGYSYTRSQAWWDEATRFEGRLVDEPCLGGPCFALPEEIIDAIEASQTGQEFRFYFTTTTEPAHPAPNASRLGSGYGYKLAYRRQMMAMGQ